MKYPRVKLTNLAPFWSPANTVPPPSILIGSRQSRDLFNPIRLDDFQIRRPPNSLTRLGDFLHFGQPFKSHTLLGNFCKGVKIIHFSRGIILGNLYRHLAIFIWSHWLPPSRPRSASSSLNLIYLKWPNPNWFRLTNRKTYFTNFQFCHCQARLADSLLAIAFQWTKNT